MHFAHASAFALSVNRHMCKLEYRQLAHGDLFDRLIESMYSSYKAGIGTLPQLKRQYCQHFVEKKEEAARRYYGAGK